MRVSNNFIANLLLILLLIPIGIWYLLKWIIKGIVLIIFTFRNLVKQ